MPEAMKIPAAKAAVDKEWEKLGKTSARMEEKPPDGYMWSGERLTSKQLTSRPDPLWPELWDKNEKECQAEGKEKVVA